MRKYMLLIGALCSAMVLHAKEKAITANLHIRGNCEMCKERIEKAATYNGVKYAEWDGATHTLVVKYMPSKTNIEDIQQHIAAAGYDTESIKATEDAYNALPKCCQYERK